MKRVLTVILAFLLVFSLVACSAPASKTADNTKYEVKKIDVYNQNKKVLKTVDIRFYEPTPNVPYIGISQFFKEFFKTDMTVSQNGDNYKFSKAENAYVRVNTTSDDFAVYNADSLGKHPDFRTDNVQTFLKQTSLVKSGVHENIISLSEYHIEAYPAEKEAYVPLSLLSNFFGGTDGYYIAYNTKSIYVLDATAELVPEAMKTNDYEGYYDYVEDLNGKRAEDLIKFNYNLLCLTLDNLRGYTNQLIFGDNNLVSLGLDNLLELYYPDIKKDLLSNNLNDYISAYVGLFSGLYDGGHTASTYIPSNTQEFLASVMKNKSYGSLVKNVMDTFQKKMDTRTKFLEAKKKAFNLDDNLVERYYYFDAKTKTAIFSFDMFNMDTESYKMYFNKEFTDPEVLASSDTFAYVRSRLYQAKKDGAENVIIDLSTNGGGSVNALMGVMGLFNKAKSTYYYNNISDKCRYTINYDVDINLDGKYDEKDVAEVNGFNFNVCLLTSAFSFSCGNQFPSYMKELGYKIVGEKSGGGSCAIATETTADGLEYRRTSFMCLCNKAGDNIDGGVPVDLSLPTKNSNNELDLSKFFDIEAIANFLKKK